jgi:acetoacetyl-CoA synthetase
LNIIHEGRYDSVVDESATIETNPTWFKGIRVNFAENILFSAGQPFISPSTVTKNGKEDGKIALTEVREGVEEPVRHMTWGVLRRRTGQLAQAMKAAGVVGGLFSSSSTDMGVKGILDRLLQIKPKWIFMDDIAIYNGKTVDLRAKMTDIVNRMKSIAEFKGIVVQPRFQDCPADVSNVPKAQTLAQFLSKRQSDKLEFERVDFRDPFLVVYSSGTTGQPKCIVHSTGGALVVLGKEIGLHRGMGPEHTLLQYTTTGWIMYMFSCAALFVGTRAVLYDGSPFLPDIKTFIRLVGEQGYVTVDSLMA